MTNLEKEFWIALDNNDETAAFMLSIWGEVKRARAKFNDPMNCTLAALVEEVGEISKAIMWESKLAVQAECMQAATMCIRMAIEGDTNYIGWRMKQHLDFWGSLPSVD